MLELSQEMASVARFVIDSAGGPTPYYGEAPEGFATPAVYFPPPETLSAGDTLRTYALEYSWHIKFFDRDAPSAHAMGQAVLSALKAKRNAVPLIDEAGALTGKCLRLRDPALRAADGAAQLSVAWRGIRPYGDGAAEAARVYKVVTRVRG